MSRIISPRTTEYTTVRTREYRWVGESGAGFSFDADATGNPIRNASNADNHDRLAGWIAVGELVDLGVREVTYTHRIPALLRCDCGRDVELDGFTNACGCGRDYNMSGQLLAPRDQWGWETGESLSGILRIP